MEIKELYKVLQMDDLCLAYSGIFSDEVTDKIIDLSEVYLQQNVGLNKIRKRTSFLVAECFQNVVRHGSSTNSMQSNFMSSGSFLIRFRDNKCFIASRNTVPLAKVDELKLKIQEINSHEKKELKTLYLNVLTEGKVSEKGGAGLGLIEMARKTENKLHYCFERADGEFCVFNLMLILESKAEDSPNSVYISELNSSIAIFKKQELLNQFLLYHGDFGSMVIDPIIDMIHNTMDSISSNRAIRMKLHHAAVEMMHNINHYSYAVERRKIGMITIGKQNNSPIISAYYNVRLSSCRKMEKILSSFKNANPAELDQHYRKQLKIASKSNAQNSWIGLIELARISHHWNYQIEDIDENLCNLRFHITI